MAIFHSYEGWDGKTDLRWLHPSCLAHIGFHQFEGLWNMWCWAVKLRDLKDLRARSRRKPGLILFSFVDPFQSSGKLLDSNRLASIGIDPFNSPLAGDERIWKLRSSTLQRLLNQILSLESLGAPKGFGGIQDFFLPGFYEIFLESLEHLDGDEWWVVQVMVSSFAQAAGWNQACGRLHMTNGLREAEAFADGLLRFKKNNCCGPFSVESTMDQPWTNHQ